MVPGNRQTYTALQQLTCDKRVNRPRSSLCSHNNRQCPQSALYVAPLQHRKNVQDPLNADGDHTRETRGRAVHKEGQPTLFTNTAWLGKMDF